MYVLVWHVYVWHSAPVCLWRRGQEGTKVVGCLHPGTLGLWEAGMPTGAVWSMLVFNPLGLGNICPAKDTPFLMPKVLPWVPSFLWGLILSCASQGAKVCICTWGRFLILSLKQNLWRWHGDQERHLHHATLGPRIQRECLGCPTNNSPTNRWTTDHVG